METFPILQLSYSRKLVTKPKQFDSFHQEQELHIEPTKIIRIVQNK